MLFSVLYYYVCVLHDISVNFKCSFYHLSFFYGKFGTQQILFFRNLLKKNKKKNNISDSLSNVCGYVLAIVIRPLDFGYLAQLKLEYNRRYVMTYEKSA